MWKYTIYDQFRWYSNNENYNITSVQMIIKIIIRMVIIAIQIFALINTQWLDNESSFENSVNIIVLTSYSPSLIYSRASHRFRSQQQQNQRNNWSKNNRPTTNTTIFKNSTVSVAATLMLLVLILCINTVSIAADVV